MQQNQPDSQPESMGAGMQRTPVLADTRGGDDTAIRAAQSTNRIKILRLSFVSMMFSFVSFAYLAGFHKAAAFFAEWQIRKNYRGNTKKQKRSFLSSSFRKMQKRIRYFLLQNIFFRRDLHK